MDEETIRAMSECKTGENSILRTDLLVLGSGAGGLAAALTASLNGLSVVVLEHQDQIGGTSARSSGTVWIPDNRYMREHGVQGDRERAERYLASLVGERGDPAIGKPFSTVPPGCSPSSSNAQVLAFVPT